VRGAGHVVLLALFVGLTAACGQTAVPSPPGDCVVADAPTQTPYPTYTAYPTYTPFPSPDAGDVESLVWPFGSRDDVILWADAADFVGVEMVVEGRVVRTYASDKAVFLNFAEDYQGTFQVVIFPEDLAKFSDPPETFFYGRQIRVQGLIKQYQGAPEIVVRDPWQIEVALTPGQDESPNCGTPVVVQVVVTATPPAASEPTGSPAGATQVRKPEAVPSEPQAGGASGVVDWQEAAAFAGETVTVAGEVVETYNSGKVVFLNFDEDYSHTFKVVIFPEAWPLFPQAPEELYRGRAVQVTGLVKMYQGAPEIIVETPDAIKLAE